MSWNGPVAGGAPFPPHPYANGQSGYDQQLPYQYGQQPAYGQHSVAPTFPAPGHPQRPPNAQPPKKKGNPIITPQPQAPYGAGQYPQQYPPAGYPQGAYVPPAYPHAGYSGPPAPQGVPPQGYGAPPPLNCPPQPFPQTQSFQWHQQGYVPAQGPQHAPGYHNTQGYAPPASTYPGYPQSAPAEPIYQAYGQGGWPPTQPHSAYDRPPPALPNGVDPHATPTPATAHLMTARPLQAPSQPPSATENDTPHGKPSLFLAWDDWDFDFEGAIWPKSNEPVDPALSLGVIIWHPAKQVTRALPSTFNQAEEQALKPTPDKLDNGESVSVYFTAENSHEAFLDVRQTDEWESIRHDPIFVVFTDEEMHSNLVSLEDCIAQRERPDEGTEQVRRDANEDMPDASWSVMDHLEQVLSNTNESSQARSIQPQQSRPYQPSQEDILAKLGVTGAPKPPSLEPVPLPFPTVDIEPAVALPEKPPVAPQQPPGPQLPPQRAHSFGGRELTQTSPPQRPYVSKFSAAVSHHQPPPPPPPPPPEPQRYGSWSQPRHNNQGYDGFRGSPALSDGSNHTMAGSDFEPEKPGDANTTEESSTTVPALSRSDSSFSRKRSYEDADHGDEKPRHHDDHTKRKRRSQPSMKVQWFYSYVPCAQ
ncbi:hypothetical protein FB567DRAFT_591322 [Paraphoma chrysanthemicola]|uniref:Uncharacterized protein n=1 Tax=Paraphoma chrysanthemicola TaxID=798071 RepID=A0A8K0W0H4_9PLEO|nr:hypothetical protein FB567DRAFT_591322 [Paraphoma chrysanthemicola]